MSAYQPPNNPDLERAVLGCMLSDTACIPTVALMLQADDFYLHHHRPIFEAIVALRDDADPLTVAAKTGQDITAILDCMQIGNALNIETYAREVEALAVRRRLIISAQKTATSAYDLKSDLDKTIGDAAALVAAAAQRKGAQKTSRSAQQAADELLTAMREAQAGNVRLSFSGVPEVDALTGGAQVGALVTVAGAPGSGKSSLLSQWGLYAAGNDLARHGQFALVFSLEMSAMEYTKRMIALIARVPYRDMLRGKLTAMQVDAMERGAKTYARLPIVIDDAPRVTPMAMMRVIRVLEAQRGQRCGLIVLDQIQLADDDERSPDERIRITNVTRRLKTMPREIGGVVLAASRVGKAAYEKGDMASPFGSGSIESDTDVLLMIAKCEPDHTGLPPLGERYIASPKNREGPSSRARVAYDYQLGRFGVAT